MILRRWMDPFTLRDRFEAHDMQPEQVFSGELLRQADGVHLIFDPHSGTITLDVDNGKWVYRIVRKDAGDDLVYARWPD